MVGYGRSKVTVRLRQPAGAALDRATTWLYTPHTISALVIGLILLGWSSGVLHGANSAAGAEPAGSHAARGVWAAILVYLGYSVVHGPETSMQRPHPAVWRLVHGALMVYVLFLTWLLYQDVGNARRFMRHLSPTLGTPVDYRSYSVDCRLWLPGRGFNWPVVRDTLFDEFVVAHTLGWWAKALAVRNYTLLWVASIAFELLELTFRHMLPNFNECWWDSWVLDVAVCNLAGILAGMATVRWFECRYEKYNWQGLSQLPSLRAKAKRTLQQLLPYSWTRFDWAEFSSPSRFLQAMFIVVLTLAFDVNVFFLKYALWIPPTNPLNTYRLLLWFACALPGVREYYEFVQGQRRGAPDIFRKLGAFAWLAIAMTCLETMLSIKFGRGLYPRPWPRPVLVAWAAAAAAAAGGLAAWQLQIMRSAGRAAAAGGGSRRKAS